VVRRNVSRVPVTLLVRAAKGNPASIGRWEERVPRPRIYRSTRAVSRGKARGAERDGSAPERKINDAQVESMSSAL
jgi:hypothetical protein